MNPKVKILILNWNGGEVLLSCIKSVSKIDYNNFEIIIIDNNSSDDSISNIHKKFPKVEVIALDSNYGYAKAYNKAFNLEGYSDDCFFMLLNNDTIVDKNIITEFLNAQNKFDTKKYILGAKIYFLNNPELIWYSGAKVNLNKGLIKHIGIRKSDNNNSSLVISTDYVTGCCIFTHNSNIKLLNGFDESFNMYFEDVDLSLRATALGIQCKYVPKAILWHKVSHSFNNKFSINKILFKTSSVLKLYNKHIKFSRRYFVLSLFFIRNFFAAVKLLFSRLYKVN